MKKLLRRLIAAILILLAVAAAATTAVNIAVKTGTEKDIYEQNAPDGFNADCILVLGAGIWGENTPSPMLADRMDTGIALYKAGAAPKLLLSGDHGRTDYNEVRVMKNYALAAGVPEEDIFMDHAGFSTYESVYRARDVFLCKRVLIVTQRYHMYRALYDAHALGLEAKGVAADPREYAGRTKRLIREAIARTKDFVFCIIKPEPKYLGEAIPITGSGLLTEDE